MDARERFQEQLDGQTVIHIMLEEPVVGDYDETLYHTRITYLSDATDGYFEVTTAPYGTVVTETDDDRWRAGIERALMGAGLPVMIGDLDHEDNVPVTSGTLYGK